MVVQKKDLLQEDIAVANHVELKPISRVWESVGHEHDEGQLRTLLLQRQQAELTAAQREGWVPHPNGLHILLPSFAPPEAKEEDKATGTHSTATSRGLTAMDTDEDAAVAAAAASQEEHEAAAAAARLLRRQQRRSEKERRRRKLLQDKKEAKARARAEAQRRYADQQQRWDAAVADKQQEMADLQQQAGEAEESVKAVEERMRELEERKHAMFLKLKQALDEEAAAKQHTQQLTAMEEGEVATSPPDGTQGGTPAGAAGTEAPATSAGSGMRSQTFGQHAVGMPGLRVGPGRPGGPSPGEQLPAGVGSYGVSGGMYGCGGRGGEAWEDGRSRDAWGPGGGGGSSASTPRGARNILPSALLGGTAGGPGGGGGTPLAGDLGGEYGGGRFRDFWGSGPGGSSGGGVPRDWPGRRGGSFDERRPPPREYAWEGGLGGLPALSREFSGRDGSRDGMGSGCAPLAREHSRDFGPGGGGGGRGFGPGGGGGWEGPPRFGPLGGSSGRTGRGASFEERERMRQQQQQWEAPPGGQPPLDAPDRPYGAPASGTSRNAWEHVGAGGSRDGFGARGDSRDGFGGPHSFGVGGGGSRDGFPAGFGRGGRGPGGWGFAGSREGGRGSSDLVWEGRGSGTCGTGRGSGAYRELPRGR